MDVLCNTAATLRYRILYVLSNIATIDSAGLSVTAAATLLKVLFNIAAICAETCYPILLLTRWMCYLTLLLSIWMCYPILLFISMDVPSNIAPIDLDMLSNATARLDTLSNTVEALGAHS